MGGRKLFFRWEEGELTLVKHDVKYLIQQFIFTIDFPISL
jgi:hypothetical protein